MIYIKKCLICKLSVDFDSVLKGDFSSPEKAFGRLYNVISILRSPSGCPWDKEQTPLSMRKDLIEEVFEAVDAITQEDDFHSKEEAPHWRRRQSTSHPSSDFKAMAALTGSTLSTR